MTRSQDTGWERDFLNDVKTNLSTDKAYFIDAILKLTEAKELLGSRNVPDPQEAPTYALHESDSGILEDMPFESPSPSKAPASTSSTTNTTSSPNPGQIIDKLSPLLEPNQVQLLKLLSGFMK